MRNKINKLITELKGVIEEESAYESKKWKRSHSNQPGVYDVRLNIGQIMILHEALKHEERNSSLWSTPVFSRKKWDIMAIEIFQDYKVRRIKHFEIYGTPEEREKIKKESDDYIKKRDEKK